MDPNESPSFPPIGAPRLTKFSQFFLCLLPPSRPGSRRVTRRRPMRYRTSVLGAIIKWSSRVYTAFLRVRMLCVRVTRNNRLHVADGPSFPRAARELTLATGRRTASRGRISVWHYSCPATLISRSSAVRWRKIPARVLPFLFSSAIFAETRRLPAVTRETFPFPPPSFSLDTSRGGERI